MATPLITLITDSYRLVNIIDANESPSAEQGQQGLRWLNAMMLNWQKDGIKLGQGWWTQDDLSADAPLPDEDIFGVQFCLGVLLCTINGLEPLESVKAIAEDAYAALAKRAGLYMESDTTFLPIASSDYRAGYGYGYFGT